MSTTVTAARLGSSDLAHLLTLGGRLFLTEASTRAWTTSAAMTCGSPRTGTGSRLLGAALMPISGRCGYNAVISRATHGVWGGQVLPGDKPAELEPIYSACSISSRNAARPNSVTPRPLPCRKTLRGADVAHN
jgi:hypothetical protein